MALQWWIWGIVKSSTDKPGIWDACHPNLEVGGVGVDNTLQKCCQEHLENYNWGTTVSLSGLLILHTGRRLNYILEEDLA